MPQVSQIIPFLRKKILENCVLAFTGIVPNKWDVNTKGEHPSYVIAKLMGASIQNKVTKETTHLVCGSNSNPGTSKQKNAEKLKIQIVNEKWLWKCNETWQKEEENNYKVKKSKPKECKSQDEDSTDSDKVEEQIEMDEQELSNEEEEMSDDESGVVTREHLNALESMMQEVGEVNPEDYRINMTLNDPSSSNEEDSNDEEDEVLLKEMLLALPPQLREEYEEDSDTSEEGLGSFIDGGVKKWKKKQKKHRLKSGYLMPTIRKPEIETFQPENQESDHEKHEDYGEEKKYNKRKMSISDKILKMASRHIASICDRIHINNEIQQAANKLFREVLLSKTMSGMRTNATFAACLYIECKKKDAARNIGEILDASGLSQMEISEAFQRICLRFHSIEIRFVPANAV